MYIRPLTCRRDLFRDAAKKASLDPDGILVFAAEREGLSRRGDRGEKLWKGSVTRFPIVGRGEEGTCIKFFSLRILRSRTSTFDRSRRICLTLISSGPIRDSDCGGIGLNNRHMALRQPEATALTFDLRILCIDIVAIRCHGVFDAPTLDHMYDSVPLCRLRRLRVVKSV